MVRRPATQPPVIVTETWMVMIIDPAGEATDLITINCETGKFGDALREVNPAYDIADLNFDYTRELISRVS